ncbi:MAG: energy transducer TonB [Bacteroidia bacterium]|nr:energy transducer TonB [Bacteroidia bacterium]
MVALLPRMRPATQKGQPTTVKYTVPIRFKLR